MLQESIPTDYFAPHLDVAIAALPALKLKDDAVEIDVLRVLGIGMGDAISAQKRSSNSGNDPSSSSNTTMDLDINKLDISQLDAILVKYKWNPNEKEIDEGTLGGKSKSDARAM